MLTAGLTLLAGVQGEPSGATSLHTWFTVPGYPVLSVSAEDVTGQTSSLTLSQVSIAAPGVPN